MIMELVSRFFRTIRISGKPLAGVAVVIMVSACSTSEPIATTGGSVKVLDTRILMSRGGVSEWHYFDFNAPEAGSATLTLSVGATASVSFTDHMFGAKVTLNGQRIVSPLGFNFFADYLQMQVDDHLRVGKNRLGVRLYSVAGTRLLVRIDAPVKRDPLVLRVPNAWPPAVPPSSETTTISFSTLVTGTSRPPKRLMLDEVTKNGDVVAKDVTELRDNGVGADTRAGDGFYVGTLDVGSPQETEKFYRLRAQYFGEEVSSGIRTFPITKLPVDARPFVPRDLVQDPNSTARFFVNQVVLVGRRGRSPSEIREIVQAVGNSSDAPAAEIVLFVPPLDIYLVEFDGDGTAEAVQRAMAAFAAHPEVLASTEPNFEVIDAVFPEPNDTCYVDGNGDGVGEQWYLQDGGIRANRAWAMGAQGSDAYNVAVIDSGIDNSHPDLNSGKVIAGMGVCNLPSVVGPHGTWVAGPIAANTNDGTGIAGVAWDAELLSCSRITGNAGAAAVQQAINNAVGSPGANAKILNLSFTIADDASFSMRTAICEAVCQNRLVVASAGNQGGATCPPLSKTPASYNNPSGTCGSCNAQPENAILAVGALDDMARAAWAMETGGDNIDCSNHGPWIDLYAPGKTILTTSPSGSSGLCAGLYETVGGTSIATAIVSGAAAVVWAANPTWTNTQVESRLKSTAGDVNINQSDYASHPYFFNHLSELSTRLTGGRLDLFAAVADPYEIVFVLDRSGSMNRLTSSSVSRWAALRAAVSGFTEMVELTAPATSNAALSLFATRVLTSTDVDPKFRLFDSDFDALVGTDGLRDKVKDELDQQNPNVGGSTAMGLGLKDGIGKTSDAAKPRVIVLFTDGEQNVEPRVETDGCNYSDASAPIRPNCLTTDAPTGSVKIITVGIDSPSSDYHTTLLHLAQRNRGKFIVSSDGATFSDEDDASVSLSTIDEAFSHAVVPALAGNSPQIVASYKGTISNTATLPAFDLNKKVSQLLLRLSFSRKFEPRELLSLLTGIRIMKDGVDITRFFKPIIPPNLTSSILLRTDFIHQEKEEIITIPPEGSYTVELKATANPKVDLRYGVVAYADDHLLDMDWQVSPAAPRVNESFNPTISLSWRGFPVADADVEAWILKPDDDLGDLLAKHPQTVDLSTAPDAGSPGYQKYLHLVENVPEFLAQLKPSEQKLTLASHGDGRYSATYDGGGVSGMYHILYRVTAEDADFGKIQRLAVQSVYTRFGDIDFDASGVSNTVDSSGVTINLRPMTIDGRFIGPAQGSAFSLEGTGIKLRKITDHQNGSYTLELAGDADSDVSVKLLGEDIYQGRASDIESDPFRQQFGLLFWLIIVAILLLLIGLAWRAVGKRRGS